MFPQCLLCTFLTFLLLQLFCVKANFAIRSYESPGNYAGDQSIKEVELGLLDTTAYVGKLFEYSFISNPVFGKNDIQLKISEVDKDGLPDWLEYNSSDKSLIGVASSRDLGQIYVLVSVICGWTGTLDPSFCEPKTDVFRITVKYAPLGHTGRLEWMHGSSVPESSDNSLHANFLSSADERGCEDEIVLANLVLCISLDALSTRDKISVLSKMADFLSIPVARLALLPSVGQKLRAVERGYQIVSAGPGTGGVCDLNKNVELSWALSCTTVKHLGDFVKVLQHNIKVERIQKEVDVNVVGWYVATSDSLSSHKRRRRQVHRKTPLPTPVLTPVAPTKISENTMLTHEEISLTSSQDLIPTSAFTWPTTIIEPTSTMDLPVYSVDRSSKTAPALKSISDSSTSFENPTVASEGRQTESSMQEYTSFTSARELPPLIPSAAISTGTKTAGGSLTADSGKVRISVTDIKIDATGTHKTIAPTTVSTIQTKIYSTAHLDPKEGTDRYILQETLTHPASHRIQSSESHISLDSLLLSKEFERVPLASQVPLSSHVMSSPIEKFPTVSSVRERPILVDLHSFTEHATFSSSETSETEYTSTDGKMYVITMDMTDSVIDSSSDISEKVTTVGVIAGESTSKISGYMPVDADHTKQVMGMSVVVQTGLPWQHSVSPKTFISDHISSEEMEGERKISEMVEPGLKSDSLLVVPAAAPTPVIQTSLFNLDSISETNMKMSSYVEPSNKLEETGLSGIIDLSGSGQTVFVEQVSVIFGSSILFPDEAQMRLLYSSQDATPPLSRSEIHTKDMQMFMTSTLFQPLHSAESVAEMTSDTLFSQNISRPFVPLAKEMHPSLIITKGHSESGVDQSESYADQIGTTMILSRPEQSEDAMYSFSESKSILIGHSVHVTSSSSMAAVETSSAVVVLTPLTIPSEMTSPGSTENMTTTQITQATTPQATSQTTSRTTLKMMTSTEETTTKRRRRKTTTTTKPTSRKSTKSPRKRPGKTRRPPKSREKSTTTLSPVTSSVFQITPAINNKPFLENPINYIPAKLGKYFEFPVPRGVFYDIEDGDTRGLQLSLTLQFGQALPTNFWLQLNPERQVITGLPLLVDLDTGYHSIIYLVATDSGGLTEKDAIKLYVNSSSFVKFTHKFIMTFGLNFAEFMSNRNNLNYLLKKISSFFGDSSSDDIIVMDVSIGSLVLSWSNATYNGDICHNKTIGRHFRRMVRKDGSVRSSFSNHLGPEFRLMDIQYKAEGSCLYRTTTLAPTTTEEASSPRSGLSIWAQVVLPVMIVLLLLLLILLIVLFVNRKRKRKAMQNTEKPIFTNDRNPVIFPDEMEGDEPSLKPKKPIVLPNDRTASASSSPRTTYYFEDDLQSDSASNTGTGSRTGSGRRKPKSPPPYYQPHSDPPPYRLPPPYLNNSSDV